MHSTAELKRAIFVEGFDLWRKLGITQAQANDIVDRVLKTGRFKLSSTGELYGDDIAYAVDEIKANRDNAFLFEPTEVPDTKPRSAEPAQQTLSAEQRLARANEQFFADERRRGRGV